MSTGSINMEPGNVAEKLGAAAGQGTKRNIGGDIELPETEKKIKLEQSPSPPFFGEDIMPYVEEDDGQTDKNIKMEQSNYPPLFGCDIITYVDEDPFKGK